MIIWMNLVLNKFLSYLKKHLGLVIITLVYLLTFLLMLPLRDAAYGDDFAYIRTAEHLARTGQLKISDWSAAAIIFQAYWGVAFTKIFGYSIKILHFSNITLFYFALTFFYLLLKKLSLSEFKATIFTLILLSYPWLFNFIYTFETDIFYLSLLIISLYFYISAFHENKKYFYVLGGIFAGLAFLNRQIGIVIPISIFLVLVYQSITFSKFFGKQLLLSIIPITIIIFFYFIWQNQAGMTAGQNLSMGPTFRKGLMISIWPISFIGHTVITSNFYLQSLHRILGYFYQAAGFLLPVFFIYNIPIKSTIQFIKNNSKTIALVSIFFSIMYLIDRLNNQVDIMSIFPWIFRYDNILGLYQFWKFLVLLSLPLGLVIVALTIKKIASNLFARKKPQPSIFRILISIYIIWALNHFLTIFNLTIKTKPHFLAAFTKLNSRTILPYLTNPDNIPTIQEIFKETWFFFFVVLGIIISLTYLFTHFKFRFSRRIDPKLMFLGLVFLFQAICIVFLAYFYWDTYIIQLIPIIIIWIAYISRRVEVNRFQVIAVLSFLLFVSLEITRNRYQTEGAQWELGIKLVEGGVNVKNMTTVNWAWRPYWLFESSFEYAVQKAGGNKYQVSKIGQWSMDDAPGPYFDLNLVTIDQAASLKSKQFIILESEPFWTFKGTFQVIATKADK